MSYRDTEHKIEANNNYGVYKTPPQSPRELVCPGAPKRTRPSREGADVQTPKLEQMDFEGDEATEWVRYRASRERE